MNHPFLYVGCFVKFEDFQSAISCIRKNPLVNNIKNPHITFVYKPEEVVQSLFGDTVQITIVGYGNDGTNEGLKVKLRADNPSIQNMIDQIEVPHITIAVSSEGKPVNTKNLNFEDINPIEMEGKYGGYDRWGKIVIRDRCN